MNKAVSNIFFLLETYQRTTQLIFLFFYLAFVVVNIVATYCKTTTILLPKETATDITSTKCVHFF